MNTKKIIITTITIFLTIVYTMTIISADNKCTGVRSFNSECS